MMSRKINGNVLTENSSGRHIQKYTALLYLLLALALVFTVIFFTSYDSEYVDNHERLDRFDFSSRIAFLSPALFEVYPERLYSPEDFANGNTTAADNRHTPFATYRLVLNLTEGTTYGLAGYSALYSMTMWVDGLLIEQVGVPGGSVESTELKEKFFTAFFVAGTDATEIIIRRSGLATAGGGRLNPLYLAERLPIVTMNNFNHIRVSIFMGLTLMASLLFLGMFLFFKSRAFFWFSMACLMFALRSASMDFLIIDTLLPDISFQISVTINRLATHGVVIFIVFYIDAMFKGGLNRIVKYATPVNSVLIELTRAATPYTFNTMPLFLNTINALLILTGIAVIINMAVIIAKNKDRRGTEYVLVLFSGLANVLLGYLEVVIRIIPGAFFAINFIQIGALVFVLVNIIALAINFRHTEAQLLTERQRNLEADEANKLLARLNQLKSRFLADISHEIRTPLTVIDNYAQLTDMEIDAGAINADTKKNLMTISSEAQRLAHLADRLLDITVAKESATAGTEVFVEDIFSRIVALCEPILVTSRNRLDIGIEKNCPAVRVVPDMLIQVLFNLIGNANRYTEAGIIRLTAEAGNENSEDYKMVIFKVIDNGAGIPSDMLEKVFQRGISGDGSSGLGLVICKEAIESHGGTIRLESEHNRGTTVIFTLPIYIAQGESSDAR
ncbi:MAG: sensor histidine kinase [Defluviitaleaceae bacterium]|nr:sensor histidine kinase [Defluviitaleaceae bacterium]